MLPKNKTVSSRQDALAALRPGDIIATTVAPSSGLLDRIVAKVTSKLQGDYTHTALYAGDGKVFDLRPETGLRKIPLTAATRNLSFMAVRPRASLADRLRAAKTLDQLTEGGDVRYSTTSALRGALDRVMGLPGDEADPIEKKRFICSNIISAAFPNVSFDPKKAPGRLLPVDLVNSPATTAVVKYVNRRQHDRKKAAMSEHEISEHVMRGFHDEVARQKVAILGAVGGAVLRGGLSAARAVGGGNVAKKVLTSGMQAAGGGKNLARMVGAGTLAGGAGLAGGAVLGRASA